ncbi:nitroreductase family protein [Eubacterium sp. 1001713B170207_170306_E7]|uniref:nitroreductase family protein n=1 Tax=Eubacterium sp. 1001713B170207_170306_E7 TaxID=2787097 RepID=UPI0018992886|nr:nitroreductase family protein [Eubacterium sp. 1001713B170207_170306_E7]
MKKNETLQTILKRRSIRSYLADPVDEETLKDILEAGMYAPNAGGQSWHFTVIQNKKMLNRMSKLAKETARQLGGHLADLGNDPDFNCLYGAPALIVVSSSEENVGLDYDCSAAMENMLLAAESLEIGSCWIYFVLLAFFSQEGVLLKKELKIPEGYKPSTAAVFGHKAEAAEPAARKQDLVTWIF